MNKDIDLYIKKSEKFAQPVLTHFRSMVHKNFPAIEETIKWGFPHFVYNGIVCSMASFKNHCSITFWKGDMIPELEKIKDRSGMGQFGKITSMADLPSDKLLSSIIKKAIKLNENKVESLKKKASNTNKIALPPEIDKFRSKNKKVKSKFG